MKKIILLLLVLLILSSCNNSKEITEVEEKTQTLTLNIEELRLTYPDWEQEFAEETLINIKNGICSLNLREYESNPKSLYEYFLSTSGNSLIKKNDNELKLETVTLYSIFLMQMQIKVVGCNNKAYVLTSMCENKTAETFKDAIDSTFESFHCISESKVETIQTESSFTTEVDEDFSIKIPEGEITYESNEDNVLSTQYEGCQITVMKYNSPIDFFYEYLKTYYKETGIDILNEDKTNYKFYYSAQYQGYDFQSLVVMNYCNYLTYVSTISCEKNYYDVNQNLINTITNSITCAKEYSIPEEITEEEPAPIEENIVETDAGLEYGINAEWVVYFLNSNELAQAIFIDYEKINLIIENTEGDNIELKADLENGQIVKVQDGLHTDAELTVIIPLQDALNLFSNVANINIENLLAFAINIKTEPTEAKQEIINKLFNLF